MKPLDSFCQVYEEWLRASGRDKQAGLRQYSTRQASYDLKKLRAKAVMERPAKSLRYRVCPEGLRGLSALVVLRNRVLVPLLSQLGRQRRCPHCHLSELDRRYENISKGDATCVRSSKSA